MATLTDPIADLLTRIRNAQMAGHAKVVVPASKIKFEIAKILGSYGYIGEARWQGEGPQAVIELDLKYDRQNVGMIRSIKRISKPSRRVYVSVNEIPNVLNGLGLAILSTSRGILGDREARTTNVGGELLCTVY
ncbi:MAG: 30S ribosomal protein S8 [Bradymonadaceae bacterium]|nr:30S ribosomal protein S8 [Lujinxingiaceae bacterium]